MRYRLCTRWPKSKPTWGYLPEHGNLTLRQAKAIVKAQSHWQRCGLQQKITTQSGKLVKLYRSRLATPEKQDQIRRAYLPELCL